jgi:beta-lactamase superfamily II metal-dependent hydrolase
VKLAPQPADNVIPLGELRLTLLSPNQEKLTKLRPAWKKECEDAGITPGAMLKEYVGEESEEIEAFGALDIEALAAEPFVEDQSPANGSSIAFLVEYRGKRLLLAGDAHPDLLESSLRALGASATQRLAVDAFKLPHHGSKFNLSKDLLELLDCRHYLVSTNGNYFKHPDDVAMARLIKFGTTDSTIHFNYKTDHNRHWKNDAWQQQYRYQVEYPSENDDGRKVLTLIPDPTGSA